MANYYDRTNNARVASSFEVSQEVTGGVNHQGQYVGNLQAYSMSIEATEGKLQSIVREEVYTNLTSARVVDYAQTQYGQVVTLKRYRLVLTR